MNASSPPRLAVEALYLALGGRTLCRDLSLTLAAGETLAILGRNGAGKSTLLAALAGLRPPSAGRVLLSGRDYAHWGTKAAARLRGWLGQRQEDPFPATALEVALSGRHPHLARWQWESAADYAVARAALRETGLEALAERDARALSGGERQRLALAALLAQEAPLMLLDEPLTHLDLNHQIAALETLARRARAGATVVMVLHDPGLALRYASRALLLYDDGNSATGAAAELLRAETLSRLYGHPLLYAEAEGRVAFVPG
ncbi:MAG: ABC transporter ATP-binding protein [Zoogloeaceae bacterium]|jgi:iron complex transport system ATP-binding protein|nr:ABC transporter ATP-binding protein [Zoogloeaceae bacterium]